MAYSTNRQEELSSDCAVCEQCTEELDSKCADGETNAPNSELCNFLRAYNDTAPEVKVDNTPEHTGQQKSQGSSTIQAKPMIRTTQLPEPSIDGESSVDDTPNSLKITADSNNTGEDESVATDSGLGHDSKLTPMSSIIPCETLGISSPSNQGMRLRKLEHDQNSSCSGQEQNAPEVQSSDSQLQIHGTKKSVETQTVPEGNHGRWKLKTLIFICIALVLLFIPLIQLIGSAPVTKKHIQLVAVELDELSELKKFARYLEIDEVWINRIAAKHNGDTYEQGYQMLLHWKQKNGKDATLTDLSKALEHISRRDLTEKLRKY